MSWAEDHRIETPEQIDLGLELAGPGSRTVAQVLDWLVKFLLLLGVAMMLGCLAAVLGLHAPAAGFALLAVGALLLFLLAIGYDIYYEGCKSGQTPGKKHVGIRVVRVGGGPIDLRAAAIRNIVGLADFLPAGYLVGGILMLLNQRAQRLGDMAAGTIVIREREEAAPVERPTLIDELASVTYSFTREQLGRLTPTDRHVLESYFARRDSMAPTAREQLSLRLLDTFLDKTGYQATYQATADLDADAEVFLASLCRDLSVLQERL